MSISFNRIIVLAATSAVLVILLGVFAYRSLATLNEGNDWIVHAQRVRYELSRLLQQLTDSGAGARRFETTHDPHSLDDAAAALAGLPDELAVLRQTLAENAGLAELQIKLAAAAERRMALSQQLIDSAQAGDVAGVHAQLEQGDNVKALEACRTIIGQMEEEDNRALESHRQLDAQARDTVSFAIIATTALAVLLLISVAYFSLLHSARLQRVQNDLATTLRSIGDAVISTDASGRVRLMNPVAEHLTGWSSVEAQGVNLDTVFSIVNEQTRTPVESPVSKVLRERKIVGLANHTILIGRDATERPIEDSGAPIYGIDGELTGVVLVFRDATSQRAAQRALIDSEAALREADQRKDIFLATLSHELRNPLAPIRNAARLLESPALTPEELHRSRSIISRQVRHMALLLDDLLDVSRITRGVLTLKKEVVELRSLFETAVESSRPAVDAKRHTLEVQWPPENLTLYADGVRLTQVVTNLLTNAAKYTDPEGIIALGYRIEDRTIVISIRDTGIGLAPEMLTKVFGMFSQVAPERGHNDGGLGIGLALVKGLVELHGGRVVANSEGLELGSEFVVYFPDSLVEYPAAPGTRVIEPAAPAPRALRVLVADDNRDSAESLGMLLELSGHEVHLAHDGIEALAIAAAHLPDVVLLDIGMPGMDGYEVAASIRRESWGSRMELIAITGWGQEEAKRKARNAGFDHHLTKPMDSAVLESILAKSARHA